MSKITKKQIIDDKRITKGNEAELFVSKSVKTALETLNIRYIIYNNLYIQFPSSYGNWYGATTEIDHLIITEQYIFIIETKNQMYNHNFFSENRRKSYWHLNDDKHTTILNPSIQNYYHKIILSEKLKVDREAIIQIVCLKDIPPNGDFPYRRPWEKNNNVLMIDDENFLENLCLLLMSKNQNHKYDFESIVDMVNTIENQQYLYKNQHIDNLERADKILDYQFGTGVKLQYTDVAYCPKCGQIMKIDLVDGVYEPRRKRRRHRFAPILKCINKDCYYKEDFNKRGIEISIDYNFDYMPSKNIVNSNIKLLTIEERLGYNMIEEYQETVLNQIENLKSKLYLEEERVHKYKMIKENQDEQIKQLKNELNSLRAKLKNNDMKLNSYKQLVGPLFLYIDKNNR